MPQVYLYFFLAKRPNVDKLPAGPELNALIAKHVFGWKNVHHEKTGNDGQVWGKKPDKLGRWRKRTVPDYSGGIAGASGIEQRMKQLGRLEQYTKELSKVAKTKGLPANWATSDQQCRAALKALKY